VLLGNPPHFSVFTVESALIVNYAVSGAGRFALRAARGCAAESRALNLDREVPEAQAPAGEELNHTRTAVFSIPIRWHVTPWPQAAVGMPVSWRAYGRQ